MKRIANSVAVQTLLSTIPANVEIRIVDMDHRTWATTEPWEAASSSIGTTYTVGDILYKLDNTKIARAKIYRTAVNDGMLLLVIDTKNEEY